MEHPTQCSVAGCSEAYRCKGYCRTHYDRMRRHGNVMPKVRLRKPSPPPKPPRFVSYNLAHVRLKRKLGRASLFPCRRCGMQAEHWAYDHRDPDQLLGPPSPKSRYLYAYSIDPDHYVPLCRSCHFWFDNVCPVATPAVHAPACWCRTCMAVVAIG